MKYTSSLAARIKAIAEAYASGNITESQRLFAELYGILSGKMWQVYCAVLYAKFKTNTVSARAENVYQQILNALEREMQCGTFEVPEDASNAEVLKLIRIRVGRKAYQRTVNAMKSWTSKQTFNEADLAPGVLESIPGISDERQERIKDCLAYAFGKLRERDADILRTMFCSDLSKPDAKAVLIERYGIDDSALVRATTRAKDRFRLLWTEYVNKSETKPVPI